MSRPQILALAQMLETGETLMCPEDYFRIRSAADFRCWNLSDPNQASYETDFGPIRLHVARIPEGLLLPGDGSGNPLLGVPASFPTEGAPEHWPKEWFQILDNYRWEIRRGTL